VIILNEQMSDISRGHREVWSEIKLASKMPLRAVRDVSYALQGDLDMVNDAGRYELLIEGISVGLCENNNYKMSG
jgi:hypothetical protein